MTVLMVSATEVVLGAGAPSAEGAVPLVWPVALVAVSARHMSVWDRP